MTSVGCTYLAFAISPPSVALFICKQLYNDERCRTSGNKMPRRYFLSLFTGRCEKRRVRSREPSSLFDTCPGRRSNVHLEALGAWPEEEEAPCTLTSEGREIDMQCCQLWRRRRSERRREDLLTASPFAHQVAGGRKKHLFRLWWQPATP